MGLIRHEIIKKKKKRKKTKKGDVFKLCGLSGASTRWNTSRLSWINMELAAFDIIWTSRDVRPAAPRHKGQKSNTTRRPFISLLPS